MNETKLIEVCFALAQDLMWEKDTAPLYQLPEDIAELGEMTNEFVRIAKNLYFQVENLPEGGAVLIGAIKYLNLQAIPPLRGNYDWFSSSLSTLLEICNPNFIAAKDDIPFLLCLQKGIIQNMQLATARDTQ